MGHPVPKTMSLGHLTNGLTWAQICAANPQTVLEQAGDGPADTRAVQNQATAGQGWRP
jgi:hypothetical protein